MRKEARLIHVNSWDEFKRLAKTKRPSNVSYAIQRSPLSKPPVGLRIMFATKEAQYVLLDFARGTTLWRTKIPVRFSESGEASVNEEDIQSFIKNELGKPDLAVYSFEILGY
ncbi:MAG TPA: hypothetical protein VJ249_03970 [Candidatus Bathyarchaeia archaeon]|nr:hypothetical protein [Candidatus Bathyarchaeia archaeon]